MKELVSLSAYLPVRLDGQQGLCLALGPSALLVDCEERLEVGSELGIRLFLSPGSRAAGRAEVVAELGGASEGMSRWSLQIVGWDGDSERTLQGHLSSRRKDSHLAVVAEEDVESGLIQRAWERWTLPHLAMPEGRPEDMDLRTRLLGKELSAPLMIAGMTGGSPRAGEINRRLAATAQELGLAMGLGSQRVLLEQDGLAPTFQVRDLAPDIFLLANVGAIQLSLGVGVDDCRRLVDLVGADALALHLNPIQEMVQPEGDRDWRDLRPRIEELIASIGVPVVVKEVGFGISAEMARICRDMGAVAIDVGGGGGTSWARIEGLRAQDPERQAMVRRSVAGGLRRVMPSSSVAQRWDLSIRLLRPGEFAMASISPGPWLWVQILRAWHCRSSGLRIRAKKPRVLWDDGSLRNCVLQCYAAVPAASQACVLYSFGCPSD